MKLTTAEFNYELSVLRIIKRHVRASLTQSHETVNDARDILPHVM